MSGATNTVVGFSTKTGARPRTTVMKQPTNAYPACEIPSTITAHSAWKAFHAGMKILQHYASHSPADAQRIAKSNLQLLHRSLSQDKNFCRIVKTAQVEGMKNHLPALQRLYAEPGAWAELVTLRDGDSISLAGISQPGTLYLLMSGSAQFKMTQAPDQPTQRWWNRLGITRSQNSLHSGDVISATPKEKSQDDGILTAAGKNCLLLRVRTTPLAAGHA